MGIDGAWEENYLNDFRTRDFLAELRLDPEFPFKYNKQSRKLVKLA